MKLLAITLLAVCLIQGNSAQFSALRNLASNAQGALTRTFSGAANAATNIASDAVSNAANAANTASNIASGVVSNAANAASNIATDAVSNAANAVSNAAEAANNIRSSLSGGAQALLDSASTDVSVDSLTAAAGNLSPVELLETIEGAVAEVETRIQGIETQLEDAVNSVTRQAEASLSNTISNWNSPIAPVLQKALAAGIDVKDCAVDGVANLAKDSVNSAVKCVTDKVKEAVTLTKNIVGVPGRAATLAKDGVTGYRECNKKSNSIMKKACQATKLVPVAVKSALLVKDTISYATQATTLVTTIQTQLTTCAAGVAAKSAAEAATTGAKIVSCVSGKLTN